MKAVDSNVLLRLITGDDPHQEEVALALIDEHDVFVPLTVILETEWVLRSFYRWPRERIAVALAQLDAFDRIKLERADDMLWAVERMRAGADFADMIHIAASGDAAVFATFDTDVVKRAGSGSPRPVETLR